MLTQKKKLHELAEIATLQGRDMDFIALGAEALQGIGAMMQPERLLYDEQLNMTKRSEVSAIFCFFGEALRAPAGRVRELTERLESLGEGKAT